MVVSSGLASYNFRFIFMVRVGKLKVLNFTALEVLPALLSKMKTQTIRKGWENISISHKGVKAFGGIIGKTVEKPARFKVGEKIKLMWNQRSKYNWFCKGCGKGFAEGIMLTVTLKNLAYEHAEKNPKKCFTGRYLFFPKVLGVVEMLAVFQIEMRKDRFGYVLSCVSTKVSNLYGVPVIKNQSDKSEAVIVEKDGFKSDADMFAYFDKHYDLQVPKKFWVYRWRWLK